MKRERERTKETKSHYVLFYFFVLFQYDCHFFQRQVDGENGNKCFNFSKVDGEVAGYIQGAKNLQLVMVRDAGTMVPYYQPWRTYDLIRRFSGVHPDGFQGTHL